MTITIEGIEEAMTITMEAVTEAAAVEVVGDVTGLPLPIIQAEGDLDMIVPVPDRTARDVIDTLEVLPYFWWGGKNLRFSIMSTPN